MLRIFVSSTSKDLLSHREAIRKAIAGLKMYPVMMEDFTATDSNAVEKCRREVLDCDIFIGIYGHRYGFIPPAETKSITELEYDWATQANKPRLIYVVDPAYEWPAELRDTDSTSLESFKQRVGLERVWKLFTSPESLATAVTQGLAALERPVTLRRQRRQLLASLVGVGILLLLLFVGLSYVLRQQQIALQPTPTTSPTPIATAITDTANREVLIVLTKFEQVGGSEEDPSTAWERTMQKPIQALKNVRARIVRYDKEIRTEEEAKALAAQLRATIVIWGWTYGDVSLTTQYTITPQWSLIDAHPDEVKIEAAPDQKIDVTIARGGDTEYVLNFVLAQLEYFGSESRNAVPYLERCIQLAPKGREKELGLAAVYLYRGMLQYELDNNVDAAVVDFTKAIELDPTIQTAFYNRGVLYGQQQDFDSALKDYTDAIRLNTSDFGAYNNRGLIYYNRQEYEKAETDFTTAIKLAPSDFNAYYNRGNLFNRLKRDDEALTDYAKAIQLSPNNRSIYNNRGLIYGNQKAYDKALADFNKAIQIDPNYGRAFYNRGNVYNDQHDYEKALLDYTKAIQIDPAHANAYYARGTAYYALHRYQEALAEFQHYSQLMPDDPAGLDAIKAVEDVLKTLTPTPKSD